MDNNCDYKMDTKTNNQYGTDQISSIDGAFAIRKRPGMYIGSTSSPSGGLTVLVREVVDNSIDEYVAGYGDEIEVFIDTDGRVKVTDHGRGIPVGPHKEWKNPDGTPQDTLTGILTRMHAGGKFGGDSGYKCFKEDSLVNTENGLVKIQDLNKNDLVINCYGEKDKIINKFKYKYDGKINKIELENGKIIEAIDGHYLLIKRNEKLLWESIENITISDELVELDEDDDVEELKRIIPKYTIKKY